MALSDYISSAKSKLATGAKVVARVANAALNVANPVVAATKAITSSSIGRKIGGVVAETAKEVAQTPQRAGVSILNTLNELRTGQKQTYTPETKLEKAIVGDRQLGNVADYGRQVLGDFGYTPKTQLGAAVAGTVLAPLDAFFSPGRKGAIKLIAEEKKSVEKVIGALKSFKLGENIERQIAPKLLKITSEQDVASAIKSAQVVSDIEREVGQKVPEKIRENITQALFSRKFTSTKEAKDFAQSLVDDALDIAPIGKKDGVGKPVALTSAKRIEALKSKINTQLPKLDLKDIDEFGASEDLKKIQESIGKTGLRTRDIEGFERQVEAVVDEVLKRRGERIAPTIRREQELAEFFEDARKSDSFMEFVLNTKKAGKNIEQVFKSKADARFFFQAAKARQEVFGVFAGVEQDENGQITIDPLKAGLGILGIKAGGSVKARIGKATGIKDVSQKVTRSVKSLLKSQLRSEARVAKQVATSVKSADQKAIRRVMDVTKREVKRGVKVAKKAKATGKKTGVFQERQRQRDKIRAIFAKFRNKQATAENMKYAIRQYASDLPLDVQRKIFAGVQFQKLKSGKRLQALLNRVDEARLAEKNEVQRLEILRDVQQLQKLLKQKGLTAQSNLKLLQEFGITTKLKPVKHFNREILMSLSPEKLEQVKELLKGFLKNEAPKIDYSKVNIGKFKVGETGDQTFGKSVVESAENLLGSLSTNIEKYGGKLLKYAGIRRYLFDKNSRDVANNNAIRGFVKGIVGVKKKWFGAGKKDYDTLTYALYNRDFVTAGEVAKKYGFFDEFQAVQKVLKKTRDDLEEAGVAIGELENYFPRVVKDYDGLYQAYKQKFGQAGDEYLNTMLSKYANVHYKKVENLTQEERADVLNKAFRGYGERINPGVGKFGLSRKFQELTDDLINYYQPIENSLDLYLKKSSEKLALMRLLGTGDDINASIGKLVEGMNMTPNTRLLLAEQLKSLLLPKAAEGALSRSVRSISTITLLSNISSAITQLADISINAIDHGFLRSLASLFRRKPIKRDEMFETIMQELGQGKFTTGFLKATGFDAIDKINIEARMGNDFRKGVRAMKNPSSKLFTEVMDDLKTMFLPEELPQVMKEFSEGKITDKTRFYVFNKVLDVSPRAISEMPKAYIDNPNMRAFYSMKSYSIKVLDLYRSRVLREKRTWKAATNFVKMTAYMMAAGMTVDQVKNWWNGRDEEMSDIAINNLLKIFMLSQYDGTTIKQDGIGSALLSKFLPPTRVFNDISKDVYSLIDDKDGVKFDSVRNLPVVGGEIYNRFGTGAQKAKASRHESTTPKDLAYGIARGKVTSEQKVAIEKMQKTNPAGWSRVKKYVKWEKLGLTDTEKSFASMSVSEGERAKAIVKHIKKSDNKQATYKRLKEAGVITDDVQRQIKYLLNQ